MSDKLHQRAGRSGIPSGSESPSELPSQRLYSKSAHKRRTVGDRSKWQRIVGCWCLAVGLLVIGGGSFAQLSLPASSASSTAIGNTRKKINSDIDVSNICVNDPKDLPKYWRPPKGMHFEDSGLPWSEAEQAMADEAVETGLNELINYFEQNMTHSRIKKQGADSVNAMIDEAYASGNNPPYHQRALLAAAKNLKLVAARFVTEDRNRYQGCVHTYDRLKYVGYGQYLVNNLPDDRELRDFQEVLVERINEMFKDCGTLEAVLDIGELDYIFTKKNEHADPVFEWVLQAIALTECLTIPTLNMPRGTEEFIANVWHYLGDGYELFYARDNPRHYKEYETRNQAWLATHIAYIPTGYGRHVQRIEDAPYLYKYIRENYYYALEYGMLDLMCEFVDLIRQYGCTEENDYQLRHGTRFILSLYEKAGHSWMNYKERNQKDGDEISDYNMIHKPWTAISGVIQREFEPIVPGSYGYAFERALEKAAKTNMEKRDKKKHVRHKS